MGRNSTENAVDRALLQEYMYSNIRWLQSNQASYFMKQIDCFARKLVAGIVALGFMAMAASTNAQNVPQVIKVLRVQGAAQYSTDSRNWMPLSGGEVLQPGSVIRTADKSTVDILLGDKNAATPRQSYASGASSVIPVSASSDNSKYIPEEERANVIRIFQSTVLGVDKLTAKRTGVDEVTETQLDLRAGQIMGVVKKQSGGSKYEVKIPNGVAGIKGTVYVLSSSGVLDVVRGKMVIAIVAADGSVNPRLVTSKNGFDPTTGLISPIPPQLYTRLVAIYLDVVGPINIKAQARVIPTDYTIIFISPVDGTSGNNQGQNNNNQGQNQGGG